MREDHAEIESHVLIWPTLMPRWEKYTSIGELLVRCIPGLRTLWLRSVVCCWRVLVMLVPGSNWLHLPRGVCGSVLCSGLQRSSSKLLRSLVCWCDQSGLSWLALLSAVFGCERVQLTSICLA